MMSQPDHQLLIQSRPYTCSAILAGILLLTSLLNGQFIFSLFIATLGSVLLINILNSNHSQKPEQNIKWLKNSSLGLASATVIGLYLDVEAVNTWVYFIPLLMFFFFDIKQALWIVGAFSILVILELNSPDKALENFQIILNYLLFLGISGSLVYLREVRRRQLKPLRRTDNLSMAASREHLDEDLTKEIQRSERKGSDLATMALAIDQICLSRLTSEEQDAVIISIGKLLHNNLRLFDSYYLWDKHEFFVVLPHTSSSQAVKIANALRVQVRKNIAINEEYITISIGVSGLNVEDDSQTLTHRATQALKVTHSKSRNRTQLHTENTNPDVSSNEQTPPDSTDTRERTSKKDQRHDD